MDGVQTYKEWIQTHKYSNGLEIDYLSTPHFQTGMAHLVVGAGTGYEPKLKRGLAHLLEHTAFHRNEVVLSTINDINAGTGVSETSYETSFLLEKFERGIEVLSLLVTNSLIKNRKRMNKEKEVIDIELRRELDRDGAFREDTLYKTLFKLNPSAFSSVLSILGTEDSLKNTTPEDLERFFQRWYVKSNMILFLVGNFGEFEYVKDTVGKYFTDDSKTFKPLRYTPEPPLIGRNCVQRKGSQNKSSIIMAWHVPPINYSDKSIPLDIATSLISGKGDIHAGLETRLRNEGLIYSLSECYSTDYLSGVYEFETHCKPGRELEIEKRVIESIERIQSRRIKQTYLERQRERKIFELMREFDSIETVMSLLKEQRRYGITPFDKKEKIKNLTPEQIQEAAKAIDPKNYAILFETPTGEIAA